MELVYTLAQKPGFVAQTFSPANGSIIIPCNEKNGNTFPSC